jgi:hypothetical protein
MMQASNGNNDFSGRWTEEMLDRFAAMVATSIATRNERMTRFEQELAEFKQTVERDHEQANAERQALARDMAQMVATRQADAQRLSRVEEALVKLTNLSEVVAGLLARQDENQPTTDRIG